jgi:hypothetical protein
MKRAIVLSVGVFALMAGVQEAAAQYAGRYAQPYGNGGYGAYGFNAGYNDPTYVVGPNRVGNNCVAVIDATRGYGYWKACAPPARH